MRCTHSLVSKTQLAVARPRHCLGFFVASSYNQTSMTATVTPTLRMPKTAATYVAANDF